MSGNTLLTYRFYSESQRMHEPCVMLSTVIEDICYMSAEKGALSMNSLPSMSMVRLWAGLRDS